MTTATKTCATAIGQLRDAVREGSLLNSTAEVLGWDQETMMPQGGVEFRSKQLALLAKLAHERLSSPQLGDLLGAAEASGIENGSADAADLREMRRDYDQATRIPLTLVEELASLGSIAQHEWADARKANDFGKFLPYLERMIELNRQKAECLGVPEGGEHWDALADTYEQGMNARDVAAVFTPLRTRLSALIGELTAAPTKPNNAVNEVAIPIEKQKAFVRHIAEVCGFDFNRGRLDESVHPFCGGSHCNDVRMTTRYSEHEVNDALGGTMHETGHGLYEQGLPAQWIGLPLGTSVSLGIHESQSRMWENQVGLSQAFWTWCAPIAREMLGDTVAGLSDTDFYGGANIVQPSFIRVEADEATYNLHIMIRFELEQLLISGQLAAKDLPEAWNALYKEYLGLDVPENRVGCLQDVHWSMGAFGYFPTYTLGNLYCAQFFEAACEAMPGLVDGFSRGEFAPLLGWLRTNIHEHGRRYSPSELCERVTGKPLSSDPLIRHLEGKLRPLYGL